MVEKVPQRAAESGACRVARICCSNEFPFCFIDWPFVSFSSDFTREDRLSIGRQVAIILIFQVITNIGFFEDPTEVHQFKKCSVDGRPMEMAVGSIIRTEIRLVRVGVIPQQLHLFLDHLWGLGEEKLGELGLHVLQNKIGSESYPSPDSETWTID